MSKSTQVSAVFRSPQTGVQYTLSGYSLDLSEALSALPNVKSVLFQFYDTKGTLQTPTFRRVKRAETVSSIQDAATWISGLTHAECENIAERTRTTVGRYGKDGESSGHDIAKQGVYIASGMFISSVGRHSETFPIEPDRAKYRLTTSIRDSATPATFFDGDGNVLSGKVLPDRNADIIGREYDFAEQKAAWPQAEYVCFNWYPLAGTAVSRPQVERISVVGPHTMLSDSVCRLDEEVRLLNSADVLYGKKYVAIGDSYTQYGHLPDQTYPHFIAGRNRMRLDNIARSGSRTYAPVDADRANNIYIWSDLSNAQSIFSSVKDADYVTIALGNNDRNDAQYIGNPTDSGRETYCGAWNNLLSVVLSAAPAAKIGIIVCDGLTNHKDNVRNAIISAATSWGIPYLDIGKDPSIGMMLGATGVRGYMNPYALQTRQQAFCQPTQTDHPGLEGHRFGSTIIEHFMRSL